MDGLTSVEAGAAFVVADPAIATDLSYVMEGVSESFAIYRASDGSRAFGPYREDSFFAPVFHGGDLYSNTLMDYDVMRDRWIVVALEGASITGTQYLDIAVSMSTAPNQPRAWRSSTANTRFLRHSVARGLNVALRDSASNTTRSLLPATGMAIPVTRRL